MFNLKIPFSRLENDMEFITRISDFDQKDIERVFVRLFSTDDGKKALAYLQATILQRALNANSSDEQLRYSEGQRAVIGTILRLIERGRKG